MQELWLVYSHVTLQTRLQHPDGEEASGGAATSEMEEGSQKKTEKINSSRLLNADGGRLQRKITKYVPSSVGTVEHKRAASSG